MSAFLDADYSAIEARIVCWLAGQEDALDRFRAYDAAPTKAEKKKIEPYRFMASDIFGVPVAEVNDMPQRFVGKQSVLLCGFQGGPTKFRDTCIKYGTTISEALAEKAVLTWRAKHKKVVQSWADANNAAKNAIKIPRQVFKAAKCDFFVKELEGMPFLLIRLPSGRKLAYPRPKIIPGKFENSTQVAFYGHILGTKWGTVTTYGGKLIENITQAVAADVMANGAHNCERDGYQICMLVHDQAIATHQEGQTPERFVELLTDLPDWADGLPIAAEGGLVPFYKKD